MPAAGYTLASLVADVQDTCQDSSGEHYTSAYVTKRINDRMADFTMRTKCRRYTWAVDIVADQAVYSLTGLTPRLIDLKSVGIPTSVGSTNEYELERKELDWLECNRPNWRTEPSTWPQVFARFSQGFDGLIVSPPASSSQAASVRDGTIVANQARGIIRSIRGLGTAAATSAYGATVAVRFLCGSMRLDGIALSTDASANGDTIEACGIPTQYQHAIFAGVLADCWGDLDVDISQPAKVAAMEAEYEAGVALASQLIRNSFQGRPAASKRGSNF